jgi:hypothetical protein
MLKYNFEEYTNEEASVKSGGKPSDMSLGNVEWLSKDYTTFITTAVRTSNRTKLVSFL